MTKRQIKGMLRDHKMASKARHSDLVKSYASFHRSYGQYLESLRKTGLLPRNPERRVRSGRYLEVETRVK
jgi:hypothetical protein